MAYGQISLNDWTIPPPRPEQSELGEKTRKDVIMIPAFLGQNSLLWRRLGGLDFPVLKEERVTLKPGANAMHSSPFFTYLLLLKGWKIELSNRRRRGALRAGSLRKCSLLPGKYACK